MDQSYHSRIPLGRLPNKQAAHQKKKKKNLWLKALAKHIAHQGKTKHKLEVASITTMSNLY